MSKGISPLLGALAMVLAGCMSTDAPAPTGPAAEPTGHPYIVLQGEKELTLTYPEDLYQATQEHHDGPPFNCLDFQFTSWTWLSNRTSGTITFEWDLGSPPVP